MIRSPLSPKSTKLGRYISNEGINAFVVNALLSGKSIYLLIRIGLPSGLESGETTLLVLAIGGIWSSSINF